MTVPHDQALPTGTRIGVYEIKNVLNVGSFDITYRAWNHHFKDWIVVREYFPSDISMRASNGMNVVPKSSDNKEDFDYGLSVFLQHAEIFLQIEHTNIVSTENFLPFNDTAYLIMSYQEGVPFSKLDWSSVPFTDEEFREILISLLQALQVVHKYKIVHGGIQPATIKVAQDGKLVLTNFSSARLAIATHTGQLTNILATDYAPAEQYVNMDKIGPATDFYALAATLYYCINYHAPVAAQDRITAIGKGKPDPLTPLSASSESASNSTVTQVINWMLCPDYGDRPQSAAEILAVLKSDQKNVKDERTSSVTKTGDDQHSLLWVVIIFFCVAVLTTVELLSIRAELETQKLSTIPSSFQQNIDQVTIESNRLIISSDG